MRELIEHAIMGWYPDAKINLEELPGGRLTGVVLSNAFADMDQIDRQSEFRQRLNDELGADVQYVSFVFLHTPHEYEVMTEAQAV
jgi:hypothetical protein